MFLSDISEKEVIETVNNYTYVIDSNLLDLITVIQATWM